jgi:MFS family permease
MSTTIYASKTVSYAIIVFLNFLSGIEYAVILPTALKYLNLYHGNEFDLGMCLSAYSFSSLFSSPLLGYWSDKYAILLMRLTPLKMCSKWPIFHLFKG